MAALTLDIKTTNELEKSALATADALDKVAAKETKVNAMIDKINASYRQAAVSAKTYAEAAAKAQPKNDKSGAKLANEEKGKKKVAAAEKDNAKATKKAADEEKKKKERQKESLATLKSIPLVLAGAAAAAVGLGVAIAASAKAAYDAKREATALIGAWTGQRAPQALALIDGLAGKLGMSFAEARQKFVEFREAGANNKVAAQMLKLRADLIAVGLSADAADGEIAKVKAAGRDVYGQARAISEIQRAYGGIGSGAKAAAYATTSLAGAQAKLSNTFAEKGAKLWEKIGPAIGTAANRMVDFVTKLVDSEEGQAALEGVASAFVAVGEAVTSENLMTALNVVKAVGSAIGSVFEFTGKALAFAASETVNAVSFIIDKVGEAVDFLVDAFPDGAAIVDGLIDGITSRATAAVDSVVGLAKGIASGFADALGIKSPSKLFAEYGKNTVQGFERGQERELGGAAMPIQEAAAEPVATPQRSKADSDAGSSSGGGKSIVIQQLIVQGGGDADSIARSIRQELQLLLQAGDMSRGLA